MSPRAHPPLQPVMMLPTEVALLPKCWWPTATLLGAGQRQLRRNTFPHKLCALRKKTLRCWQKGASSHDREHFQKGCALSTCLQNPGGRLPEYAWGWTSHGEYVRKESSLKKETAVSWREGWEYRGEGTGEKGPSEEQQTRWSPTSHQQTWVSGKRSHLAFLQSSFFSPIILVLQSKTVIYDVQNTFDKLDRKRNTIFFYIQNRLLRAQRKQGWYKGWQWQRRRCRRHF